ncbi:hypothetical protein ACPW90_003461 [Providencia rettgeri]
MGANSNNLSIEQLHLNPLSVDDVKEYLRDQTCVLNLSREQLDKILEITAGLPSKIDLLKDYLRLMSLNEVLSDGVIKLSDEEFSAEISTHLINRIENLKLDHKNIHRLLEVFAVLDCGERLKNIREHFSDNNFIYNDFSKLERDGLIYPISINNETILKINPLVRDYVSSSLTKENYLQLVKKCLAICIGASWMSGKIKIGPVTQFMLLHTEFYPGNVHTLIRNYLELTIFDLDSRETKSIIMASIGYCMYLHQHDYFKEIVSFSRMVYQKIKSFECKEKYQFASYLATGLRMIDEYEECVDFLEPILTSFSDSTHYSKQLALNMMVTIMYSLSRLEKTEKMLSYAKKIKLMADKNSNFAMSAESEMIEQLPRENKIDKLIKLEKRARKYNETITANNISLRIYSLLSSNRDRYVDSVINNNKTGIYTRVRGLVSKYESTILDGAYDKITTEVINELKRAYDYLFCQRLDSLFNRCSDLLWKIAAHNGDVSFLSYLFKNGSIIWRVNSATEKELLFANALISIVNNAHMELGEVQYLQVRISVLSGSNQSEFEDSVVSEQ